MRHGGIGEGEGWPGRKDGSPCLPLVLLFLCHVLSAAAAAAAGHFRGFVVAVEEGTWLLLLFGPGL